MRFLKTDWKIKVQRNFICKREIKLWSLDVLKNVLNAVLKESIIQQNNLAK
jgi:hypothetical protein